MGAGRRSARRPAPLFNQRWGSVGLVAAPAARRAKLGAECSTDSGQQDGSDNGSDDGCRRRNRNLPHDFIREAFCVGRSHCTSFRGSARQAILTRAAHALRRLVLAEFLVCGRLKRIAHDSIYAESPF